ncbi:MAG: insulinase family protein [Desulfobulbaceae bacterium]|nr:insulinase family protein [Desulfobulbaceae bacterium]
MKPDISSFLRTFVWPILAIFVLAGCGYSDITTELQEERSCISRGWPHDEGNLRPDPALHFGTLDNGLRYIIMRNEEPKDRVGLYLNIQAGSLAETDSQLGYAHFLEHMLFNGTTNYPPGTLVEYFQSIGMGFGSDTNAHTSFDETVYRLLLPDGTEENLSEGLLVMADYARGALLLENEVERERGIILAEKRARDSAGYRLYEKRTRFSFAGTRVAERFPIGTEETLKNADAQSLRSFYDAWYQPENMILLVVGDVDVDLAEKLIFERLAPLAAPAKEPECYDFGRVEEEGDHFLYVHEPDIGSTELTIGASWNTVPEADTVSTRELRIKKHVAASLLQNRLQQLVREPGSPLTKAQAYSGNFLERIEYATVAATLDGENWQEGLGLLVTTLRQAMEYGFSSRELARVKKEITAQLQKEVQTASSRDSRKIASAIINAVNNNEVLLSPEQELQLYGPVVEAMTPEDANDIFSDMWGRGGRKIIVAGTALIEGENPEDVVRRVYEDVRAGDIAPWKENDAAAFPYLPVPDVSPAVTVMERFDAIDTDRYTFANGTVLHVKKTPYQPNQALLEVHFGSGKRSEKVPGLGMLADSVVNASGVGKLTRNELEDALAGHNINVSFKVGEESFILRGSGLSTELELLVQLVYSHLLDPAFREDAYRLSMERTSQMYEQMSSSVEGMMQLRGDRFLAGGNPHYGMPSPEQFKQLTLDQVRDWLIPFFAGAPLEISVVGDVDTAEVVESVGQYFGTMGREYDQGTARSPVVFPSGESMHEKVETQVDKALVAVAWPTDDFWDISRTRRLNILSAVFGDRLRVEIREKLGAVYSPRVYNQSSRTEPGYGVLRAVLTVDPALAEEVAAKVREVGSAMADDGVGEAELSRSLEPVLTSIKDMMQTNRYWMESVLALSSRHPQQLEWPLTIQHDFASITVREISDFAARYLNPEVTAQILFTPATP